ncbi:MAG: SCP2 sterol-binding domain-containing protein [bacterium]
MRNGRSNSTNSNGAEPPLTPDAARARILLETFLPLLEDFVEEKPGLRALARRVSSVQVEVEEDEVRQQLAIVNGEMKVGEKLVEKPSFVLRFESLEQIGELLRGKVSSLPKVNRWSLADFTGTIITSLSALLGAVLYPKIPLFAEADRKLRAKLLLHAASYAMESVARMDAEVHEIIEDTDGDVVQIGISPSGPHIHVVFRPGEITAHRGAHPAPHAEVVFESIEVFNDLVSQKLDPMKAYAEKTVRIEGESALVLMVGVLAWKLMEYLM